MFRLILLIVLLLSTHLHAQTNYSNHWYFGKGHNTNFSTGTIANGGIPNSTNTTTYTTNTNIPATQMTVSDSSTGAILFFYHIPKLSYLTTRNTYRPILFDKDGIPMSNGYWDIQHNDLDGGVPICVPHPTNSRQYYVFCHLDKKLFYNIIDMNLNNGKGDILPNYKMIPLNNIGATLGSKMTIIKGCNALWLVVRSSYFNGFIKYKIDKDGLHTTPILEHIGTLSAQTYIHGVVYTYMKASPNGLLLAIATPNGVELYDVEPCSGKIYNPRIIDTTASVGIGYSPNNKLLYTTRFEYATGYKESSEVVQWDVSNAQDINSIKASEQVILINSAYYWPLWRSYLSSYMGDIAHGNDGKLYILSNTVYDNLDNQYPIPLPPTTVVPEAQTMHIIHQPNNRGMACMPERDAHYLEGSYMNRAGYYLPHPILTVPSTSVDTVYGTTQYPTLCFGNAATLYTPTDASCIAWSNGASTNSIRITDTGTYWVQYYLHCQIHIDTYIVQSLTLPHIPTYILACKDRANLTIVADTPYTTLYHYLLWSHSIADERRATTDSSVHFPLLHHGYYSINISTPVCDTTINIEVANLPQASPVVSPTDTTIPYGTTIALEASGSLYYTWQPRTYLDTASGPVVYTTPQQDISYTMVSINEYGCIDTAYCHIAVQHYSQLLLPNAFSPNGDGLNDRFDITNIGYERITEWAIYNRYGSQVFAGTSIHDSWDGTHAGKPCDVGVYYYYIQYVGSDGRIKQRKGEVHLVR
jgi:gliding motility-associated-like protein